MEEQDDNFCHRITTLGDRTVEWLLLRENGKKKRLKEWNAWKKVEEIQLSGQVIQTAAAPAVDGGFGCLWPQFVRA